MTHEMWIIKYRPRTLDEYVWSDQSVRRTVENWLSEKALPHCLFSGHQGCGKTSLALLLLDLLEIPPEDTLRINASRIRKVEDVQENVINFLDAWAFNPTGIKYILLDEADRLSQHSQGLLRAEMENYPNCRFIMTCNEPRKIAAALHSRMQEIRFMTLNRKEFALRTADILIQEEVRYEPEVLIEYIERFYPDLRKCIGTLQQNSRDSQLLPLGDDIDDTKDYLPDVIKLFLSGRYRDARERLIAKAAPEDYMHIYRFLYQNLNLFGLNDMQQDRALIVIRDAIFKHDAMADQEINIAACFAELSLIAAS